MSTLVGNQAEAAVAEYLVTHGFEIMARNWRQRRCEIDIVAKRTFRRFLKQQTVVYCIEVKYRRSPCQGGGLDYITPVKQKQMTYAARQWVHVNQWSGDIRLLAVAVSGASYDIDALVEVT